MNRKLSALIIICLLYSLNIKSETTIRGKNSGKNPTTVEYSVPINSVCYGGFKESTKTDSLGNFQFKINTDKPIFISTTADGQFSNKMVIEPEVKYEVAINLIDKENRFNVLSPNGKGQNLYSSFKASSFL